MSKGSERRLQKVSNDKFDNNWDRIFNKTKKKRKRNAT